MCSSKVFMQKIVTLTRNVGGWDYSELSVSRKMNRSLEVFDINCLAIAIHLSVSVYKCVHVCLCSHTHTAL